MPLSNHQRHNHAVMRPSLYSSPTMDENDPIDDSHLPCSTPKSNQATSVSSRWCLIIRGTIFVLVIVYSIAAFILNWQRARALFCLEMAALVIAALVYLHNANAEKVEELRTRWENAMHQSWEHKGVRWTTCGGLLLVLGAIVAVAVQEEMERLISGV